MITIRDALPQDTPDIARIHIDMWRIAYEGILADEYLRGLSYSRSRIQWQLFLDRHAGVLLAADSPDDGVVGFAAGGAAGGAGRSAGLGADGELMALYVLAAHHGRGIGRMLTAGMAERLAENGRGGMLVWVLADNPARDFYEHLGARKAGEQGIQIGDRSYREVAYVWDDLRALIP